ncbi:MAG: DivIVA domain-containing protein [Deltaproteobacteria bacterium]|nr:DivIVA domain-containing protein [Deltaproteobacteria bacterium]
MKITPLDIRQHRFKKRFRGYDPPEVDAFLEVTAETLEEAVNRSNYLEGQLKGMTQKLEEHEGRERLLKEAITTAQGMVEDMRNNALKEAELIISEAKAQADKLIREAHQKVVDLRGEVYQLKKQRLELQSSIKAVLDYHNNLLNIGVEGETVRSSE